MNSSFCCSWFPCQEPNQMTTNMPDVQSMQQVDDLIAYIDQFMRQTNSGFQQQIARPNPVNYGSNLIQKLSKRFNWHVSKKCFLSALDHEARKVVADVAKQAQHIPYLGMALSIIAHMWERAEQASSSKDECLRLLKYMSTLAKHMKNLETHLHQGKLDEILVFIVKGTLICERQMEPRCFCRFIFAPLNAADIEDLKSQLLLLYPDLQLEALTELLQRQTEALNIQTEILNRLPVAPGPSQGKYPIDAVGIGKAKTEVINLLDLTGLSVKVVVIYGFGGIGKTTLASTVFSELPLAGYDRCRVDMDHDSKTSDLLHIQKHILHDLFQKRSNLYSCKQGREELSKAFGEASKPVFLFIDNALREKDLNVLLPIENLSNLPVKSRIFVTTRNLNEINILRCRGAIEICPYRVAPLLEPEDKRLLCHYALGDKDSSFDSGVNMDRILQICGGIPLVLEIVGSKLSADGNTVSACNAILDYYEEWLRKGCEGGEDLSEIMVDFVYKRLREASREAFLDIVFFYHEWEISEVSDIVGEVCLQDLERTALVFTTSKYQWWNEPVVVKVHDIVRARGRRLSGGNRIIDTESLSFLLRDEQKLQQTKGIWLPDIRKATWFSDTTTWTWNDEVDFMIIEAKHVDLMSKSLRVLSLGNAIKIKGRCDRLFEDLRFLNISFEDVFPVDLSKSSHLVYFESWSMNGQGFPQLPKSLPYIRILHLVGPLDSPISLDIGELNSLRKLELFGLKSERFHFQNLCSLQSLKLILSSELKRLPENFGDLSYLQTLKMNDCFKLETLPESFGNLSSMRELDLHGCSMLERIPDSFRYLSSLQKLDLHGCCKLERLPESFGDLSSLQKLDFHGCSNLERLPESFGDLSSLQKLDLHGCSMLEGLPESFGYLSSLQELDLHGCLMLERLPGSFGNLNSLENLKTNDCPKLQTLPESFGNLFSMKQLDVYGCSMLKRLPQSFGNLSSLQKLEMNSCFKLERLESLGSLSSLQSLKMQSCERIPENIGNLSSIRKLDLNSCSMLERLPESIGNLFCLQEFKMNDCSKLERLHESFGNLSSMRVLDLIGCSMLERLPESFGNLCSLRKLKLNDCSKLQRLPQTFDQLTHLYSLEIDGGEKFCSLFNDIGRFKCLKFLSIRNCKEVKRLPEDIQCSTSLVAVKAYGCAALEAKAVDCLIEIKSLMFLEIGESPMLIKRWQEIQQEDRPLIGAALRLEPNTDTLEEIMSSIFFSKGSRFVRVDRAGQVAEVASTSLFPEVGGKVALLLTPWGMSDQVLHKVLDVTSSEFQIIYVDVDVEGEAERSRWMAERDIRIREALVQLPQGSRAWTCRFRKASLLFAYLLSMFARIKLYENSWWLSYTPNTSVVGTSVFVDEEGRRKLSPLQMTFPSNAIPSEYNKAIKFRIKYTGNTGVGTFAPLEEAWSWIGACNFTFNSHDYVQ